MCWQRQTSLFAAREQATANDIRVGAHRRLSDPVAAMDRGIVAEQPSVLQGTTRVSCGRGGSPLWRGPGRAVEYRKGRALHERDGCHQAYGRAREDR